MPDPHGHWRAVINSLATPILAVILATGVCSVALLLVGHNPLAAWQALIQRAFLRPAGVQEMLVAAAPLLLAGVAVAVAARAGLWNIGIDGQVLVGALAAAWVGTTLEGTPRILLWAVVLVTGVIGGLAWVAIPALLRARFGTNEIVTTIMFNYVALSLTSWLVKGPLRDDTIVAPQTAAIPPTDRLPLLANTRVHAGVILALVVWGVVTWWLHRSTAGFDIKATGENPRAAIHALIPVGLVSAGALLASGALAGLVGAGDILSTKGTFQAEWNPGYGLTAFALVFLARKNFLALLPAALFLGLLSYGADVMPRAAGVPSAFFAFYEGVILIVLAVFAWQPWHRKQML
ncbi:MAG TPA: ABC transporter permease [Thermomicrobiales bacterium]|nr:ABC transporter permease [Thermomicrobiales bacterium]